MENKNTPEISVKAQEKIIKMLDELIDMDIADRAAYVGDYNGYNVFVTERSDGKTVFVGPAIFYFVKGDHVREVTSDEPEGEEALNLL